MAAVMFLFGCAPGAEDRDPIEDVSVVIQSAEEVLTPKELDLCKRHTSLTLRVDYPDVNRRLQQSYERALRPWMQSVKEALTTGDQRAIEESRSAISEANRRVENHYQARNLPYAQHDYFYVPENYMSVLGGVSLVSVLENTILLRVPTDAGTVAHEEIHANSVGLGPNLLDEGLVSLLTWKLFTSDDIAFAPLGRLASETEIVLLIVRELARASGIAPEEAFQSLLSAFHTGDLSDVHAAITEARWSSIVDLVVACDDCQSIPATGDSIVAFTQLDAMIYSILRPMPSANPEILEDVEVKLTVANANTVLRRAKSPSIASVEVAADLSVVEVRNIPSFAFRVADYGPIFECRNLSREQDLILRSYDCETGKEEREIRLPPWSYSADSQSGRTGGPVGLKSVRPDGRCFEFRRDQGAMHGVENR